MPRILLIEDNPANMELMNYLLKAFGHATFAAFDGARGVSLAFEVHPDVILCDLALPRMDGFAVVQQLKADQAVARIPVVAVTASAMVGDKDKVLAAGFDGYIAKPIDPETFVSEVEAFVRG